MSQRFNGVQWDRECKFLVESNRHLQNVLSETYNQLDAVMAKCSDMEAYIQQLERVQADSVELSFENMNLRCKVDELESDLEHLRTQIDDANRLDL